MAAGGRKSPTNHVTAKANLLATRLCHVAHSEITTSLGGRIALCIDPAAPTAATVVVPSASVYAVISAWPGVASRRVGRFDVWFRPQLRPSVRPVACWYLPRRHAAASVSRFEHSQFLFFNSLWTSLWIVVDRGVESQLFLQAPSRQFDGGLDAVE